MTYPKQVPGHFNTGTYDDLVYRHNVTLVHYDDVIMSAMASQITSLTIVHSTVYSGTDERKHQSSMSLAFVRGIHRWLVNSPRKGPVMWNMFPFDEVMMVLTLNVRGSSYLGLTRSISWLLMPWLLTSPGRQQPWYWLCRIGRFLSYLREDFN